MPDEFTRDNFAKGNAIDKEIRAGVARHLDATKNLCVHEAKALFAIIASRLDDAEARRIFAEAPPKRRGRQLSTRDAEAERWLAGCIALGVSPFQAARMAKNLGLVHSESAAVKRIQRLKAKDR